VKIPSSENRWHVFKSHRCGYEFSKFTPSSVEKCPKCKEMVIARGADISNMNPYSKAKMRWYKDESGKYHADEIKRRGIVKIDGKDHAVVKDDKGLIIDYMPSVTVTDEMGTKKALQE